MLGRELAAKDGLIVSLREEIAVQKELAELNYHAAHNAVSTSTQASQQCSSIFFLNESSSNHNHLSSNLVANSRLHQNKHYQSGAEPQRSRTQNHASCSSTNNKNGSESVSLLLKARNSSPSAQENGAMLFEDTQMRQKRGSQNFHTSSVQQQHGSSQDKESREQTKFIMCLEDLIQQ